MKQLNREFDEDDILWFGTKFRGQRLGDLPGWYLIWLWNDYKSDGLRSLTKATSSMQDIGALARWIEKQLPSLKKEFPDKIILPKNEQNYCFRH